MQPDTYHMLAFRQDSYWWHRARRAMAVALARRYGLRDGCRWLDIGCGPGGNLDTFSAWRPALVVGIDLSPLALGLAKERAPGASLLRADINRPLPLVDETFDVVTIFNVLYHDWVARESDVLAEVRRVLRPGGLLILTEPAFAALSREMDVAAMTRRRYRHRQMQAFCRSAGLEPVLASYFTSFGAPLLLLVKAVNRLMGRGRHRAGFAPDMRPINSRVNQFMLRLALAEAGLVACGVSMPFGTTLVCVARK